MVEIAGSRFEFRAWGVRGRTRMQLSRLADIEQTERIEDCYLLVADPFCNAKIRCNRLKIKHLVEERNGFQRWSRRWHDGGDAPAPFGDLVAELCRSDVDLEGRQDLVEMIDDLGPRTRFRAVFVTKRRRRYRFGSIRAEIADLQIEGRTRHLRSTAIEGPDLGDLISLRSSLGLTNSPNVALHVAVSNACRSWWRPADATD